MTTLARRLNAFDATMLVMGGIIGSGIFTNPQVVARQVHTSQARLQRLLHRGAKKARNARGSVSASARSGELNS